MINYIPPNTFYILIRYSVGAAVTITKFLTSKFKMAIVFYIFYDVKFRMTSHWFVIDYDIY